MSILPPQHLRKTSKDSQELSERSENLEIPEDNFKEIWEDLKARQEHKDFFNMILEDEEEELESEIKEAAIQPLASLYTYPSEKTKELAPMGEAALIAPLVMAQARSESIALASKVNALPPEIEAVFEKMASSMIVMSSSHEVETTLFLDNPHFASSPLFGTKITIREFSTAPLAFNVEIVSNPLAVAAIDASKNDLLSAFQNGRFNFSIHRFDTHIEQNQGRPVLHRKDSGDEEQKQQRGDS